MPRYKITFDASYCYETQELEAVNILHLLGIVISTYCIDRITKIELI